MPSDSALPGSDDIRLLTEIGFLAAGRGELARAEVIFSALALLRPDKAFAHVGLAMALMNRGRHAEAAARTARVVLPTGPERDLLGAIRGLALQLDRHSAEATQLLRAIVNQPTDPALPPSDGVRLARRLLGDVMPARADMPASAAATPV